MSEQKKTSASNEAKDKNEKYNQVIHSQFVGQWITSLAISVVCCAIIFVVFASYMVRLYEKTNIADVRIELLQEKYTYLQTELSRVRRAQPSTIFNLQGVVPSAMPSQGAVIITQPPAATPEIPAQTKLHVDGAVTTPELKAPSVAPKVDLGVPPFDPKGKQTPIGR